MAQYTDIIIPSGSKFNNATIKGFGNVSFKDSPKNQFDNGQRVALDGSYKILEVVDRSKEDTAPFTESINNNGFSVKIGTIVNIELTKDVTAKIPTELIIYNKAELQDENNSTNTINTKNTKNTKNTTFTTKNIIIGIIIVGVVFSILKYKKII